MRFLTLRLFASVAASAVLAAAVPSPLQSRSAPTPPSSDSFYGVPADLDSVKPGSIIRHRSPPNPIAAFGSFGVNLEATHQILYRTTDAHDNATATVVTVLVPHGADMGKVLSYQVAQDSASPDCAPSYALQLESATGPDLGTLATQAELLLMEAALEQGWVVIVPDFEGPHGAYLANLLAGHATLDGIRAALQSGSFTGVASKASVAMWGYSGGSQATNFAAELHASYAPELDIVGAAVGGTVPNITTVVTTINKGPFAGFIPTGVLGLSAEYPALKAEIDKHLLPQYADRFRKPLKQCLVANAVEFAFNDVVGMLDDREFMFNNPIAVEVLIQNALGRATPKIPLFWYKSVHDEISPVADSDALVDHYCSQGATIEYVRDLASEHATEAAIGAPKALAWLRDVLDGNIPEKGCSTETKLSSLFDPATIAVVPKFILDALFDLIGKPVGPLLFG